MFQPLLLCYAAVMSGSATEVASAAVALARNGQVTSAYKLLQEAIRQGDPDAAAALANWRIAGDLIRRDLPQALEMFERAYELGLPEALPPLLALLANGAGGTVDRRWADAVLRLRTCATADPSYRRQADLLDAMRIDDGGLPLLDFPNRALSEDPEVRYFSGFLTSDECNYVIERARPLLQPAVVVHPQTGALVPNPVRTSSAAFFPFVAEDPVLNALNNRIAAATATSYRQGEPLQVLSYLPGQQYKLHSDALPAGNQRIRTFLVYLNEDYDGGATFFPDLGLRVRGRAGDALMFVNVDRDDRAHSRARHAGEPVTRGEKMLLSKWIRRHPLDLAGPPGRPF